MDILGKILTLMLTAAYVHAHGIGAPEGACDSLMPYHDAPAQNSVSPFKITTSKTSVRYGEEIKVTLSGKDHFKGFFLRAKQNNTFIDGTFQEHSLGLLRCNGHGITHNNPLPKNNVNIVWKAPSNLSPLPVTFVATFVQEKMQFWTEVSSAEIAVISNPST